MDPSQDSDKDNLTCRRWDGRAPMDIPARLMLSGSNEACLLEDLSMGGARIAMPGPPRCGAEAFLEFGTYQVYCSVVWVRGEECGIKFDQRLPKQVIIQMREFARNVDLIEAKELRSAAQGWSTGRAA